MARRSDHTREQLREIILAEAHRHMAEVGFHRFSAREVAKRIGYSVGTIYNVYGSLDALLVAVNTRTMADWTRHVERALARSGRDRLRTLVEAYFDFAERHRWSWSAIYEHHLPDGESIPADDAAVRGRLTGIIADEVARSVPDAPAHEVQALTRSLIATVHGHCAFALNGNFALMGEDDPVGAATARVTDAIRSARSGRA